MSVYLRKRIRRLTRYSERHNLIPVIMSRNEFAKGYRWLQNNMGENGFFTNAYQDVCQLTFNKDAKWFSYFCEHEVGIDGIEFGEHTIIYFRDIEDAIIFKLSL